jgi:hypothetical protein
MLQRGRLHLTLLRLLNLPHLGFCGQGEIQPAIRESHC